MKKLLPITILFIAVSGISQAEDKSVIIENASVPVTVLNPVTSVDVTGTVDASGSDVNATIMGTPDVNISNDTLTVTARPDLSSVQPVTIRQRINSDNEPEDRTGATTVTFVVCIGDVCRQSDDAFLSDKIRYDADHVLVVTSITAYNFSGQDGGPSSTDYALLSIGACNSTTFPRSFGFDLFTVDGRKTTHLTFRPGFIISDLQDNERVCFTSLFQSTIDSDAVLHGYLIARP